MKSGSIALFIGEESCMHRGIGPRIVRDENEGARETRDHEVQSQTFEPGGTGGVPATLRLAGRAAKT